MEISNNNITKIFDVVSSVAAKLMAKWKVKNCKERDVKAQSMLVSRIPKDRRHSTPHFIYKMLNKIQTVYECISRVKMSS